MSIYETYLIRIAYTNEHIRILVPSTVTMVNSGLHHKFQLNSVFVGGIHSHVDHSVFNHLHRLDSDELVATRAASAAHHQDVVGNGPVLDVQYSSNFSYFRRVQPRCCSGRSRMPFRQLWPRVDATVIH